MELEIDRQTGAAREEGANPKGKASELLVHVLTGLCVSHQKETQEGTMSLSCSPGRAGGSFCGDGDLGI